MPLRKWTLTYLAFFGIFPLTYAFLQLPFGHVQNSILASALISYLGFLGSKWLIPLVGQSTLKAGIFGLDLNKVGTPMADKKIPEGLGLAVGVVYLICVIMFEQFYYHDFTGFQFLTNAQETATADWLVDFNAALATICFMLFLGFVDDVLNIRWRVKLILPAIAALPLLVSYSGGTGIAIPKPLQFLLGVFVELAGVNGLEAGQTFLIACAIALHNLFEIGNSLGNPVVLNGHLFSLFLMLPLITCTFALLTFNWYPSQVFVGDTFTYFAGMTIAVAGILGHFSETLLIFLIPQIFNFVYSVPQLFGFVPCPRHRLPKLEPSSGMLMPTRDWNLVNLTLQLLGTCSEEALCVRILAMQYLSCCFAFFLRWSIKGWYK
eukprot:g6785.t1